MTAVGLLIFVLGLMCRLALLVLPGTGRLRAQIRRALNLGKSAPTENQEPTERSAQIDNSENQRLRDELTHITDELQQQIEELMMMQRVDKELSATLNFDNVMMLTMDWAIRRTGATAGVVNMGTHDGRAMYPVAALGYPLDVMQKYNAAISSARFSASLYSRALSMATTARAANR